MIVPAFLSEAVRTVLVMTASGSLLILLLLALKPFIRHRLPKTAQYDFWFVVLAALLVPISRIVVLPQNTVPIVSVAPIHSFVERNIVSMEEESIRVLQSESLPWGIPAQQNISAPVITDYTAHTVQAVPPPEIKPSPAAVISTALMLIYPWGVFASLFYSLAGYVRFLRKLRQGYVKPSSHVLEMLAQMSKGRRTPRLLVSDYAETPMLVGLFKPTVVLPDREYSSTQLHGILLHELTHMRCLDIVVKWLSLFSCAIHWFNPLVWLARREIDRLCELSCDETVIQNMDESGKQDYGETLISVASEKKIPLSVLSTTMCEEKRVMKERLLAIMKSKKHTKSAVLISFLILLASVVTAFTLGASSAETGGTEAAAFHAEENNFIVGTETVENSAQPEICPDCGDHYIGENLREPTPPLNLKEIHEVDDGFVNSFENVHEARYIQWETEYYDTLVFWPDVPLREFMFVTVDYDFDEDAMLTNIRAKDVLLRVENLQPNEAVTVGVAFEHYIFPSAGIEYVTETGEYGFMIIGQSMRGGCYPGYLLTLYRE